MQVVDVPVHNARNYMAENCQGEERVPSCQAEELSDARHLPKEEVIKLIENLALAFITSVSDGQDPQLVLVSNVNSSLIVLPPPLHTHKVKRSQKNVIRDSGGRLHLGKNKTVKRLFARNAAGAGRFAKSESLLMPTGTPHSCTSQKSGKCWP